MTHSNADATEHNSEAAGELGKGSTEYQALESATNTAPPSESQIKTPVASTLETAREAVVAATASTQLDRSEESAELRPFPTQFFEFDKRSIKKRFSDSWGKRIKTRLAIIWYDDDDDRAPHHAASSDIRFHELRNSLSDTLDGGPEEALLEDLKSLLRPPEAKTPKKFPDEFFDRTLSLAQEYTANPPKSFQEVLRNPEAAFRYAQMGALMQTPAFWADERSQDTLDTLAALPEGTQIPHPHYAEFKRNNYGPQIQWRAGTSDIPGIARVVGQDSLWQGNPKFAKNFFDPLAILLTDPESPLTKYDGGQAVVPIRAAMAKQARENQQPGVEERINRYKS